MDSKVIVDKVTKVMSDRKAKDIDVIEVTNVTILADYFVICSGTSNTHIRAIADEIDFELEKSGVIARKEGLDTATWVLMDYGSVIVHIFYEEDREYYSLERLWSDGVITRKE